MGLRRTAWLFIVATILFMTSTFALAEDRPGVDRCFGTAAPESAEIAGAIDGATVALKDGRIVRLAGIIAPTEADGDVDAARDSAAALHAIVRGRTVRIHRVGQGVDRYGRVVAQLVVSDAPTVWLQAAQVRTGHAQVMPALPFDCSARLLIDEREAQKAVRGIWSGTAARLWNNQAIPQAAVAEGRFALVEAVVRRVGEGGGRIFLDFGPRHREDFTIVIPREAHAAFAAAGVDLRVLSGKRVRARGVLFSWGGPAMELRLPGALELIEAGKG